MPDGGFLVNFDNKNDVRCFAISFDYDLWQYTVNEAEKHSLPPDLKSITIKIE